LNIGSIPTERSVLWNFGPHDATLILAALPDPPVAVSCQGGAWIRTGCQDEVTVRARTASGAQALIQLSWLHPVKEQRLLIHGEGGSLVFDDTQPWPQKLRHFPGWDGGADGRAGTKALVPPAALEVAEAEPLRRECAHFLDCCRTRREPRTGPAQALAVQELLDAAQRSLDAGGAEVGVG
jgi:UDP-2-acetamido-3-amino-2,3-dideoxy-glucuronate N-acetyltransferase